MDKPFSGIDFEVVAPQAMNRSGLLASILCIPLFCTLLKGDFVVILMSVVAGYAIHTLLS